MTEPQPHDLRQFFHAVGSFSGERALTASPMERPMTDQPVELIDTTAAEIDTEPLAIAGVVDGIQASICVTYRSHRPVYLSYVAAGCVGAAAELLALRERLNVVCSSTDTTWAQSLQTSIPIVELAATDPSEIERIAAQALGGDRENLERGLIEDLVDRGLAPVLVDGSLVGRPPLASLVGVVKTTQRRYLDDESVLHGLPMGWRSPRFKIPAGSQGVPADRYSCYLRLFDASSKAWNFGLIRLEAFDLELLEPLAARALVERQGAGSGDARWDRHLTSVRACEEVLRARRPAVYGL